MLITKKELSGIYGKMEQAVTKAQELSAKGDIEGAKEQMALVKELKEEYTLKTDLYETQKEMEQPSNDDVAKAKKAQEPEQVDGFVMVAKMLNKRPLTDVEKSALVAVTDETAPHGENFILPQDIRTQINELRRAFVSAKDLITVTPVTALSGSDTYAPEGVGELTKFADGEVIPEADIDKFAVMKWAVDFYGKLIPISNILIGAEQGGLMAYLRKYFIKASVMTENKAIFEIAKTGTKMTKTVDSVQVIRTAMNTQLDPDHLMQAVIVTNQTGFDFLDSETDAIGRPMLRDDETSPSGKSFAGKHVVVFPLAQLPDITAGKKAPIYVGSFKDAMEMKEYDQLLFATSTEFLFNRNQLALRVMQAFDLKSVDKKAILVGEVVEPKVKVVITEAKTAEAGK